MAGMLRGEDSTGMFQIGKDLSYEIVKLPYSGEIFVRNKAAQRLFGKTDEPGCTILHHRAATRGTVSQANAHPFEHFDKEKAVVGVHNGTLTYGWARHLDKNFDVDSDYLIYRIFKDGAQTTFSEVTGAYACLWYENDGILRMLSNGERSLYFGFVKNKNMMLIASEHGMLWWLASRNGVELEKIVAPDKDFILSFPVLDGEVRDFTMEKVEKKEISKPFTPAGKMLGWDSAYMNHNTGQGTASSTNSNDWSKITMESMGVKKDDLVDFFIEGSPTPSSTRILGWIGTSSNFERAVMFAVSPNAAEAMITADFIEVKVIGVTTLEINGVREKAVVVSTPTAVASKDSNDKAVKPATIAEIIDSLEDDVVVNTVPGPNGRILPLSRFFKMTENGCINCGNSITPRMATEKKLVWVNNDQDAMCPTCVEDTLMANGS